MAENGSHHPEPVPSDPRTLKAKVDEALAAGDAAGARGLLVQLWQAAPDGATAAFIAKRFESLGDTPPRTPVKVAFLRSFTVEPALPLLRAEALLHHVDPQFHLGDFNTYSQDILNPESELYRFDPKLVVLAVQTGDLAPDLWARFTDLEPAQVRERIAATADTFRQLVRAFRGRSKAHLLIHNFERPAMPAAGVLDAQMEMGQAEAISRLNAELASIAREHANVYVLDYDGLAGRRGREAWRDERKFLSARMPVAARELIHLAREWMRFLAPISGRTCKALVCDLDNTLWGGVIGEDGLDGIRLDREVAGAAYTNLQRAIQDLYQRGIILAVCSKNNPADAMEAIEKHPGMLLKPDQFACFRMNWQDKAQNLREIARELNIGLDALCFIDDNPAERLWVRSQLPEVAVIELGDDPMTFADALRRTPVFERLSLSEEDRLRGRMYAEQRLRSELQTAAGSLEEYYRSLQMAVEITGVTPANLTRLAQLTQKTNQFNLTTRRYSEQQVKDFADSPDAGVAAIRVRDRFGDNGIVGVAIFRRDGDALEIDSFLLSCRVIGRSVETAFLAHLAEQARARGLSRLTASFIPTRKNAPAKDFLPAHGFTCTRPGEAESRWELDLASAGLEWPPFIERASAGGATKPPAVASGASS